MGILGELCCAVPPLCISFSTAVWHVEKRGAGTGKHVPHAVSVGPGFHHVVLLLPCRSRCHGRSVDHCGEREKDP